jgi:hypothetical protein
LKEQALLQSKRSSSTIPPSSQEIPVPPPPEDENLLLEILDEMDDSMQEGEQVVQQLPLDDGLNEMPPLELAEEIMDADMEDVTDPATINLADFDGGDVNYDERAAELLRRIGDTSPRDTTAAEFVL